MLPEVLEKIKVAREFGDLSENSEYDAAKKEYNLLMQEIETIEETLRKATIIDSIEVTGSPIVFDTTTPAVPAVESFAKQQIENENRQAATINKVIAIRLIVFIITPPQFDE